MVQGMSAEEKVKPRVGNKENWYKGSVAYWDSQPVTIDGVLGGYGKIHEAESDTSRIMLEETKSIISGFNTALDCGAGIGSIAKTTLLPVFKECDILEPSPVQIEKAKENVPNARNFYCQGL